MDINQFVNKAIYDLTLADIQSFQKQGGDIDGLDSNGWTAFVRAGQYGRLNNIKLLKEAGANINKPLKNGYTPLHYASANGSSNFVKLLLEFGANKETKNINVYTPLHYASANGHPDCVKLLLEFGANKEAQDKDVNTPLHWASNNGHPDCLKLLLEFGANKEAQDKDVNTPLHKASSTGRSNCVKLLLEFGANKEAQDKDVNTPLHWASHDGRSNCVKLLLEFGANKETKNNYGDTPLHWASHYGRSNCVKLLLEFGANKETKNNNGKTSLDVAKNDQIKAILLNPPTIKNPIFGKATQGNLTTEDIENYLKSQHDLNEIDPTDNMSSLMKACHNGHTPVASLLIQYGADIFLINKNNQTAYDLAQKPEIKDLFLSQSFFQKVCNNSLNENEIKDFLSNGGNIDIQNPTNGFTPLMYACRNGNSDIVTLLIRYNAKTHFLNKDQKQAIDLTNDENIISILLQNVQQHFHHIDQNRKAIYQVLSKNNVDPHYQDLFRLIEYLKEEKIDDSVLCPFCHSPPLPPFEQHTSCGYSFCQTCLQKNDHCPKCSNFFEDKILPSITPLFLKTLDELKMICPNCRQIVLRGDIYNHISQCPLLCPHGCQTFISLNEFPDHEKKCIALPVLCPASSVVCTWKGRQDHLSDHVKICPYIKILPILERFQNDIHLHEIQVHNYSKQVFDYQKLISQQDQIIQQLQQQNIQQNQINQQHKEKNIQQDQIIQQLQQQNIQQNQINQQHKEKNIQQDQIIQQLQQQNIQLDQISQQNQINHLQEKISQNLF